MEYFLLLFHIIIHIWHSDSIAETKKQQWMTERTNHGANILNSKYKKTVANVDIVESDKVNSSVFMSSMFRLSDEGFGEILDVLQILNDW